LFSLDFQRRFPGGVVGDLSELGYMGWSEETQGPLPLDPSRKPGPLLYPGNSDLSRLTKALAADFRRYFNRRKQRWVHEEGGYRKCDALGVSPDGRRAELLEVTTGRNRLSAVTQLAEKLAILRGPMSRIHDLRTDWLPSKWRPVDWQAFYPVPSRDVTALRYICYMPTYLYAAPDGVVL